MENKKPHGNKGKIHSPEIKLKQSISHLGHVRSELSRKKQGNTLKGKMPKNIKLVAGWNKGLKGYNAGIKSHLWKGGITSENQKIRHSLEMKCWRKACFERDDYTCQKTGERGGDLIVHHINNFADFPELRTSIENGITLLRKVHIEFHKIYGKRNNTKEQLEEFLNKK